MRYIKLSRLSRNEHGQTMMLHKATRVVRALHPFTLRGLQTWLISKSSPHRLSQFYSERRCLQHNYAAMFSTPNMMKTTSGLSKVSFLHQTVHLSWLHGSDRPLCLHKRSVATSGQSGAWLALYQVQFRSTLPEDYWSMSWSRHHRNLSKDWRRFQ